MDTYPRFSLSVVDYQLRILVPNVCMKHMVLYAYKSYIQHYPLHYISVNNRHHIHPFYQGVRGFCSQRWERENGIQKSDRIDVLFNMGNSHIHSLFEVHNIRIPPPLTRVCINN